MSLECERLLAFNGFLRGSELVCFLCGVQRLNRGVPRQADHDQQENRPSCYHTATQQQRSPLFNNGPLFGPFPLLLLLPLLDQSVLYRQHLLVTRPQLQIFPNQHAQAGVTTLFIAKSSPWENGYVESFNGKFRDELLNGELFLGLADARWVIDRWRLDYNHRRPHSALGYQMT